MHQLEDTLNERATRRFPACPPILYTEHSMLKQILLTVSFATLMGMSPAQAQSPSLVNDSKVYELRTYHAYPGKLEDLHKRFREHTLTIFARHGMKVVGFGDPPTRPREPRTR